MLDDYISDKHVSSTLSNKLSLSASHGKRQRTKGPANLIIDTLKNKSEAARGKALKTVLNDTSLKSAVAQAGFINQSNPDYAALKESWENTKKFVGYATSTDKKRGRPTDDQRGAVEALLVATSATPETTLNMQTQSQETEPKSSVSKRAKARLFVHLPQHIP